MTPRDTIVIPAHNQWELTRGCLDALLEQSLPATDIVVVDDGSSDGTRAGLSAYTDRVHVVHNERATGFAQASNAGAALAGGTHIVFLNNDTVPEPGWLEALRAHGDRRPLAAVCGARLLYPDGTVQHAGVCFRTAPDFEGPINLYAGLPGDHPAVLVSRPLQAVTGACMRVEREAFRALGGFDPSFDNGYEDVDLCLRMRESGRQVEYCADAVVVHLEGATRGSDPSGFNERLLSDRWAGRYEPDELAIYARDGLITLTGARRVPEIEISPLIGVPARSDVDKLEARLLEFAERDLRLAAELSSRPARHMPPLALRHGSDGEPVLGRSAVLDHVALDHPLGTTEHLARLVDPLVLSVSDAAPVRLNVLVGELRPADFAAAPAAKLDLAARLAAGGRRVRLVTADGAVGADELAAHRLGKLLANVELSESRPAEGLEVSPHDTFLSTTWWTAHLAHHAARQLGGGDFVALIQEHEPLTVPNGSFAAAAEEALTFPHRAIFSTELLREHFREHRLGVFAGEDGEERSVVFRNPLAPVEPPVAEHARQPGRPGLLLYAHPGATEARNMFELAILALRAAVAEGVFAGGALPWRFEAVGVPTAAGDVPLGDGNWLLVMPRLSARRYRALLQRSRVGLALLHSPHPGMVPLEMAASGLVCVTNTYGVKTADRLGELAPNLVPGAPTVAGLSRALATAVERAADLDARLAAATGVRWPRTPDEAYDDVTVGAIEALLDASGGTAADQAARAF